MLSRIFNFFMLLLLLFSYSLLAEADSVKQNVKYSKLINGLDIYVIENHRIPAVLHAVIYKVGGMDDPIGKSGLAHYFEHLMFETTGKFSDIELVMSSIGAQFNAFTTREYTCYYELVLKEDLPLVMEIEADRMSNFTVTQEKINKQKNIVLEERRMRFDLNPNNLLLEEMNSIFYRSNSSYSRSVIGWEHDIRTYNKDDIMSFRDKYYHPSNAILLIVGDVEFEKVEELARTKYGKIKARQPVIRYYPNKSNSSEDTDILVTLRSLKVKEPILYFRYCIPTFKNVKEMFAANLAIEALGSGKSSRLHNDLVLDKNIAVSISTHYLDLSFSEGYVDIIINPKIGIELNIIEKELINSINNFIIKGITREELHGKKSRYKAMQFDKMLDLTSMAMFYIPYLAFGISNDNLDILSSKKIIDEISLDDVNNKINSIFSCKRLTGHLLPKVD